MTRTAFSSASKRHSLKRRQRDAGAFHACSKLDDNAVFSVGTKVTWKVIIIQYCLRGESV